MHANGIQRIGLFLLLSQTILLFALPYTLSASTPAQAYQNQLVVSENVQPQPTSFMGFYDTLFPLTITVNVYNPTSGDFPGGNITGTFNTPSGKWVVNLQYSLPVIPSNHSYTITQTFRLLESGVYVISFSYSVTFNRPEPYWGVSGGFVALQAEPPLTLVLYLILVVLAVGFAGTDLALIFRAKKASRPHEPPRLEGPELFEALSLFDAGQKMQSYLLEPKDDVTFEAGVAWLLEILGFQTMKLNKHSHGEVLRVKESMVDVLSADILARDSATGKLSVVSCTINLPKAEKRQAIILTAREIRSRLGNCEPILVTNMDVGSTILGDGKREGIAIVDGPQLASIMELVTAGRVDQARKYFD